MYAYACVLCVWYMYAFVEACIRTNVCLHVNVCICTGCVYVHMYTCEWACKLYRYVCMLICAHVQDVGSVAAPLLRYILPSRGLTQVAGRFFSEYVHPLRQQQPAAMGTPAGCRVIVSHHRFEASDSPLEVADLEGVVGAMVEAGADIAKFAIMPCDIKDNATAFQVLQSSPVRSCLKLMILQLVFFSVFLLQCWLLHFETWRLLLHMSPSCACRPGGCGGCHSGPCVRGHSRFPPSMHLSCYCSAFLCLCSLHRSPRLPC